MRDARTYISSTNRAHARLVAPHGRSPRGVCLRDYTPCGHWQTHTVVAASCINGLVAPAVFDGPLDNPHVPRLCRASPRADAPARRRGGARQLAMHKQPEVHAAIARLAARLRFLPPYSPDFNPIELAFAKLKAFLRAARPRSFDQVVQLVAIAVELFSR